ncbi:MAG: c-type cytochrome [Pseudomonadota bacterium]
MKSKFVSMVTTVGLVMAYSALAVDMPAAAKAKCSACHDVKAAGMGPSYTDISVKYKGDKEAAAKIAASTTKGGSFGWNLGSMPPRGMGATDSEIKSISGFIAGLAK